MLMLHQYRLTSNPYNQKKLGWPPATLFCLVLYFYVLFREDDLLDDRGLMAVWNEGQGWDRFGDDQVSFLSFGYRADNVADAHCVC